MAKILDFRGLRCPQPVLKAALEVQKLPGGTEVEIVADCPDFPHEVKQWCEKSNRTLVDIVDNGDHCIAKIVT
ncbi:sulfurtransferase TusA family protein [candidate division FCPU426 bacterium]|nr:sulfurtransferase TusA family protein [candidate division FCPU426 bacterium]